MNWSAATQCTAFLGHTRVGQGALSEVVRLCKPHADASANSLLIFNNSDSSQIEVDFRGSLSDVLARLPVPALSNAGDGNGDEEAAAGPKGDNTRPGRGRPKLGVVAREITLLPRHWEWLKSQPGGASVALRKLVENARKENAQQDQQRAMQDAAYRFMSVMAGSLVGFEEASRALFAGDGEKFVRETEHWPEDVRTHARSLSSAAFAPEERHTAADC